MTMKFDFDDQCHSRKHFAFEKALRRRRLVDYVPAHSVRIAPYLN